MASTLSKVTDELSMIQGELFAERKAREESYDLIIKKLGGQILKLNETISQERSVIYPNLISIMTIFTLFISTYTLPS